MISNETYLRVANAFRAMKAIGIREEKVEPALKKLLKLSDKNWALIEAENYRALANAILEREVDDCSKKIVNNEAEGQEAQATEEPEQPLKRLRPRNLNSQKFPLNKFSSKMPKTSVVRPNEGPDELNVSEGIMESPHRSAGKRMTKSQVVTCQSPGSSRGKEPISSKSSLLYEHRRGHPSQSSITNRKQSTRLRTVSRSPSHGMKLRDRGKVAAALQIPSKKKRPAPQRPGTEVNKTPSHALKNPKGELITNEMPCLEVPDVITDTDARRLPSGAKAPHPKSAVPTPPCDVVNRGAGDEIVISRENQEICAEKMNDPSLVTVQQPLQKIEGLLHDVIDIAKGHENVVITLVNEVNDESPPSFYYIPQNAVFQNAYMNVSLARIGDNNCCVTCSGDCLSSSIPCACSYETGGEFAYTSDGLVKEEFLKECVSMNRNPEKHCQFFCKECPLQRSKCEDIIEPCKGHLVRKFIKECWRKCGCNKQCGNRVVQRGITRKLQVFMTQGKGWGLRTLEDLPKGAFVCEYVGEVLTNTELFERVLRNPEGEKHSYPVLLDADWCAEGVLKDEEALCLDATYYGNVARFINHKCHDSTLVEIPVEVETPDHHYYHLAFFTTRKVKAMEELTWDYGIDFDDHDHPIKAFRCQCGSKFCRNIKRRSRARR